MQGFDRSSIRNVFAFLVVACAAAIGVVGSASAEEEQPAEGGVKADLVLAKLGQPIFQAYCASCHGIDGRGDGPVASSMQTPPADLRRIAQRRGGTFPDAEIARKIDGRFEIGAHGSREMPVWGRVFGSDVPDSGTAESITRGKLAVLVEYLKSIQDPPGTSAEAAATRAAMGEIFEAMRVLLPLSLEEGKFEDPANQAEVSRALDVLDRSSAGLGRHGASSDVSFAHLARSLAIETRDVKLRYAAGHRREARYLIQTLTETCVACHSRLPAASAPRSQAFVRDIAVTELPIEQQAKLAYATRQFDVAQDLYEQMLAGGSLSANDLNFGGHLDDYLELTLRVRLDVDRPIVALERFSKRDDLTPVLREEVAAWIVDLRAAASREPGPPLAIARVLVTEQGKDVETERHALVRHLEASGLLHRTLGQPHSQAERAEAYYLLGLIETRIGRSYWLSQAEAYLETAIRLAPGEDTAADAYALLDEFLVAGYSGSGGTHVPPDIQAKLDQLRAIAESAPEA